MEVYESDYQKSVEGIPVEFNINYEDVDGNQVFQTFQLKEFDNVRYYSLESIEEV